MLRILSSGTDSWLTIVSFMVGAAVFTGLIGFLFRKKPALIFLIPAVILVPAVIFISLGLMGGSWEIIGYFLIGFILLAGAGGSLVGALIAFFFILKGHKKKTPKEDGAF